MPYIKTYNNMINVLIFLIGVLFGMMAIYPYIKCVVENLNNEIYYNNKGIRIRDEKIKHLKEQLQNNKIEICDIECKEER